MVRQHTMERPLYRPMDNILYRIPRNRQNDHFGGGPWKGRVWDLGWNQRLIPPVCSLGVKPFSRFFSFSLSHFFFSTPVCSLGVKPLSCFFSFSLSLSLIFSSPPLCVRWELKFSLMVLFSLVRFICLPPVCFGNKTEKSSKKVKQK